MSACAAQCAAAGTDPGADPESGRDPRHITKRDRRAGIVACMEAGIAYSHAHANRLINEWQARRAREARQFVIEEFRLYAKHRGDLLVVRSKPRRSEWRTHT